jgi:hypothetical protein
LNQKINPLAIASVVCGVMSVLCSCVCYGFPFNLAALVLGIIAIAQIGSDPSQSGKGLAFAGIGLFFVNILVLVGLMVFGFGMGVLGGILENL